MNEPYVGEIRRGRELGKTNTMASENFLFQACMDCGKKRWVLLLSKSTPETFLCQSCNGKRISKANRGSRNSRWNGGRYLDSSGYVYLTLQPYDPFYSMADPTNHQVLEHRYVMAKKLNRPLTSDELIHHKGTLYSLSDIRNKSDNRDRNLKLVTKQNHIFEVFVREEELEEEVIRLYSLVERLEKENIRLKEKQNGCR